MDMLALAQQCAPGVEQHLAVRLMHRESSFNPFAIGVIGGPPLESQPRTLQSAISQAERLIRAGKKIAVGIAQIHIDNIRTYKLTWRQAFDPCTNLRYGQTILHAFHTRALKDGLAGDEAVLAALRGYNSGNLYAKVSDQYAASILGGFQSSRQSRSTAKAGSKVPEEGADDEGDIFAEIFVAENSKFAGTGQQSADIFSE